jgi:inhibitor of cysteine peptidase
MKSQYGLGILLAVGGLLFAAAPMAVAATNDAAVGSTGATNGSESALEEYLNPGAPIQVAAGRKFIIRIQANPTTGYGWQLSKPLDEAMVILVTNTYAQQATPRPLAGVGGHELWTFKAVGRGQTEIALKYVRPWEKDQPPAATNVFTVIVK